MDCLVDRFLLVDVFTFLKWSCIAILVERSCNFNSFVSSGYSCDIYVYPILFVRTLLSLRKVAPGGPQIGPSTVRSINNLIEPHVWNAPFLLSVSIKGGFWSSGMFLVPWACLGKILQAIEGSHLIYVDLEMKKTRRLRFAKHLASFMKGESGS